MSLPRARQRRKPQGQAEEEEEFLPQGPDRVPVPVEDLPGEGAAFQHLPGHQEVVHEAVVARGRGQGQEEGEHSHRPCQDSQGPFRARQGAPIPGDAAQGLRKPERLLPHRLGEGRAEEHEGEEDDRTPRQARRPQPEEAVAQDAQARCSGEERAFQWGGPPPEALPKGATHGRGQEQEVGREEAGEGCVQEGAGAALGEGARGRRPPP